jgi:hypothetical protein
MHFITEVTSIMTVRVIGITEVMLVIVRVLWIVTEVLILSKIVMSAPVATLTESDRVSKNPTIGPG